MKTFASASAILLLIVAYGYWHYGDVWMARGSSLLALLFAGLFLEETIRVRGRER